MFVVHTTSWNDIREIYGNLEAVLSLAGRLTGIPLVLRRVERDVSYTDDSGKRKKYPKWLLHIEISQEWVQRRIEAMQRASLVEASSVPMLVSGDFEDDDYDVETETGEVIVGEFEEAPGFTTPPPTRDEKKQPRHKARATESTASGGPEWHTRTPVILCMKNDHGWASKRTINTMSKAEGEELLNRDMTDEQVIAALVAREAAKNGGDVDVIAVKKPHATEAPVSELDTHFGSATFWHKLVRQSGLDETDAREAVVDFIAGRGAKYEPTWHDDMVEAVIEWMAEPEGEPLFVD